MVSSSRILVFSFVLLYFFGTCYGAQKKRHFSDLKNVLTVGVSPTNQVMKAGVDAITVSWGMNQSSPTGTDAEFKKVKVQLCFAPISQKQRAWRKTEEELLKDKTCQFLIVAKPYIAAGENFTWTIKRNIPSATYFVRAYAFSSEDHEVAFGQSTDAKHDTNLFTVQAITGRHASIDICAGVFSAFSVITLFVFFFLEKRKKALNQLLVQLIWFSSSCVIQNCWDQLLWTCALSCKSRETLVKLAANGHARKKLGKF